MAHPHEISLICIGPLTNIALAIKVYPEIKDKIKEVFIMGGNHRGESNMLTFRSAGLQIQIYDYRTWECTTRSRVQLLGRWNSGAYRFDHIKMSNDCSYI